MGLQAEEDIVDRTDLTRVISCVRTSGEVSPRAFDLDPVLAQGLQVRPAGDEVDLGTAPMQGGSDVGTDGTGTEDSNLHWISLSKLSTGCRRRVCSIQR